MIFKFLALLILSLYIGCLSGFVARFSWKKYESIVVILIQLILLIFMTILLNFIVLYKGW